MKVLLINGSPKQSGNTALARNMVFPLRSTVLDDLPEKEPRQSTNFIR